MRPSSAVRWRRVCQPIAVPLALLHAERTAAGPGPPAPARSRPRSRRDLATYFASPCSPYRPTPQHLLLTEASPTMRPRRLDRPLPVHVRMSPSSAEACGSGSRLLHVRRYRGVRRSGSRSRGSRRRVRKSSPSTVRFAVEPYVLTESARIQGSDRPRACRCDRRTGTGRPGVIAVTERCSQPVVGSAEQLHSQIDAAAVVRSPPPHTALGGPSPTAVVEPPYGRHLGPKRPSPRLG
jgi:hypothetical protein